MDRLLLTALLASLLAGCSCERAPEPPPEPVRVAEPTTPWPRALVPDLEPATPATEVTVRPDWVDLDNADLIATWPALELERAEAAARAGRPGWPRLSGSVTELEGDPIAIAPLRELLETARQAERAGTGAGTGAGAFNLRVASDVPFELVERVLYTASQAGYSSPRLLLDLDDGRRVLPWPSAPPRQAPTREQIEAALQGHQAPGESEVEAAAPRATLDSDRITVATGEQTHCTFQGAVNARRIQRCVGQAREAGDTLSLSVASTTPFGRVAPVLQALTRVFPHIRILRR